MDGTKILQAAAYHRSFLLHTGVQAIRLHEDQRIASPEQSLAHALFLASEVPAYLDAGRHEKAQRWLSCVQGMLLDRGLITTRVLKDVMRPDGSVYSSAV